MLILVIISFAMFGIFDHIEVMLVDSLNEAQMIMEKPIYHVGEGVYNGEPPHTEFYLYQCKDKKCIEISLLKKKEGR